MAGVVEFVDAPSIRGVLVFSNNGNAGVIEHEEPLVLGLEI